MNEIWKPIDGTNGKYEVSNTGKIRSNRYLGRDVTKELSLATDHKGYLRVRLYLDDVRKTVKVHREVAKAFIPNPENKPEVNHINGVKTDNRAENLEWVTAHENTLHAYRTGLREKTREHCRKMGISNLETLNAYREKKKTPVIATCIATGEEVEFQSQAEAARVLGTAQPDIYQAMNGKRKSLVGYTFRYKEGDKK